MPTVSDFATRQAQEALGQLLADRPEFKDNKTNSIHDLLPFLEIEEDSEKWLPLFNGNTRALSLIWQGVIKNGVSKQLPFEETAPLEKLPEVKPKVRPAAKTSRKVPESALPNLDQDHPENLIPAQDKLETTGQYEIVPATKPETNPVLDERSLQTSRALAEQFTIVQYYEHLFEKSQREVEEITLALAKAKQDQLNAGQAYANSLEDLARLMASSLGSKASEFSKLFTRVVGGGPAAKK